MHLVLNSQEHVPRKSDFKEEYRVPRKKRLKEKLSI